MTMKKNISIKLTTSGIGSDEIYLKNPIFGDEHSFGNNKILNKSMFDYNNLIRPTEYKEFLTLRFEFHTMTNYVEFEDFLVNNIGKKMSLLTHHNIAYDGTVVGPFVFDLKSDELNESAERCTTGWGFIFEVEQTT